MLTVHLPIGHLSDNPGGGSRSKLKARRFLEEALKKKGKRVSSWAHPAIRRLLNILGPETATNKNEK